MHAEKSASFASIFFYMARKFIFNQIGNYSITSVLSIIYNNYTTFTIITYFNKFLQ